ncbi:hypothetical protein [Neopusillimonas aromaticivorans]|uniref:hypothetical protein n=1 Tax=Neopusillimonas aromaticivorans TaxID=2979868 RepID=UPI002594E5A7|nr:hypothetical protein [Neopusillimonas aromaticivorans]WJJ93441.1 hypothetical protein N7E01_15995 [Neopusillimonas aromaticivorans]
MNSTEISIPTVDGSCVLTIEECMRALKKLPTEALNSQAVRDSLADAAKEMRDIATRHARGAQWQ